MAMNKEQVALDMGYSVQRYSINIPTRSLSHLNLANVRTFAVICDKFKAMRIRISAPRPACSKFFPAIKCLCHFGSVVWPFAHEYGTLAYGIIVRL